MTSFKKILENWYGVVWCLIIFESNYNQTDKNCNLIKLNFTSFIEG